MKPCNNVEVAELRTYIDTFAGAGGSTLGLREAGWHGLFAIEKDPMAFETLERNFMAEDAPFPHFEDWPKWLQKKAQTMESLLQDPEMRNNLRQLKGKISLIIGGPPCQGFSVGGSRNGYDVRNELVFELLDMVRLVEPPFVLIENVEGMSRAFSSRPRDEVQSVAEVVVSELKNMGYSANFILVDASDYGVPQVRKRIIIGGISKGLVDTEIDIAGLFGSILQDVALEQRAKLGLPTHRPVSAEEALHDLSNDDYILCPDSPKFNSTTYLQDKSVYATLMRQGIPAGEIPNSHRFSYHGPKVKELYVKAHEAKLKGRLSKKFLLENGTKTNKKFLLDPNKPSSTLTTHPDEFIHYLYPRNISIREMARLQSFPDKFWFYGRYTLNGDRRGLDVSRCAQVGNAIPPLLGRALGEMLLKIIELIRGGKLDNFKAKGESTEAQLALWETIPMASVMPLR